MRSRILIPQELRTVRENLILLPAEDQTLACTIQGQPVPAKQTADRIERCMGSIWVFSIWKYIIASVYNFRLQALAFDVQGCVPNPAELLYANSSIVC